MILVLDTHPVVWFLEASSRLSSKAQQAISDPSSQLIIPSIVSAEITYCMIGNASLSPPLKFALD